MPRPTVHRPAQGLAWPVLLACVLLAGCGGSTERSAKTPSGQETTVPGAGSTTPAERLADGSVPWIDAPTTEEAFSIQVPARRAVPGAPHCRADGLRGELPRWTAIIKRDDFGKRLGNLGLRGIVEVENVGERPCSLQGEVPVRLTARAREPEGVEHGVGMNDQARDRVTALSPGAHAEIELRWTTPFCGTFPGAQTVELELPHGGGTLRVPVDRPRQPECTAQLETASGTRSFLSAGAFDEQRSGTVLGSPLNEAEVRVVDTPSTARAGEPIRFAVELRNPTGRAMPLDPCPGYFAEISPYRRAAAPENQRVYRLNCEAVDAIPARGSVRFRMVLPFRGAAPAGSRWQIAWNLRARNLAPSDDSSDGFEAVAR